MHEAKTYRQYIEQTPFESVWGVLRVQYGETEDVRQSYIDLCEELKTLPPSLNVNLFKLKAYITLKEKRNQRSFYI